MSFFGLGLPELFVIFAVFVLVLGPKRLPNAGKYIAKYLGGLRSASEEFNREIDVTSFEDNDSEG